MAASSGAWKSGEQGTRKMLWTLLLRRRPGRRLATVNQPKGGGSEPGSYNLIPHQRVLVTGYNRDTSVILGIPHVTDLVQVL
jgi:hypothetical protein